MKPLQNNRPPQRGGARPPSPRAGSPIAQPRQKSAQNNATGRPISRTRRPLTRTERLIRYVRGKIASLPTLLPEGDTLLKALICALLILFFALLQTTIFARFRPFGAVPDLMLSLVIAISLMEGEVWGASVGIAAAFVIESLGATGIPLLPLLYMPIGYFCPIVTREHLTDSLPVRILLTAVAGVLRAIFTLIYLGLTVSEFRLFPLIGTVTLPEGASTFVLAFLPHLITHLSLRTFHKSRAERTSSL